MEVLIESSLQMATCNSMKRINSCCDVGFVQKSIEFFLFSNGVVRQDLAESIVSWYKRFSSTRNLWREGRKHVRFF